jgi:hypothetical protein
MHVPSPEVQLSALFFSIAFLPLHATKFSQVGKSLIPFRQRSRAPVLEFHTEHQQLHTNCKDHPESMFRHEGFISTSATANRCEMPLEQAASGDAPLSMIYNAPGSRYARPVVYRHS